MNVSSVIAVMSDHHGIQLLAGPTYKIIVFCVCSVSVDASVATVVGCTSKARALHF